MRKAADELTTYLGCPRKYEFKHVLELTGETQQNRDAFRKLLREVICTGYNTARQTDREPRKGAHEALESLWKSYVETADHHSRRQESTEKARAEAGLEAYFETVGPTHLDGIERAAELCERSVVGPDLTLSTTIQETQVSVTVDYIMAHGGSLVAVRLTDQLWASRVPYASDSEIAQEHLEQGLYAPQKVGTVIGARIAEQALGEYVADGTGTELMYLSVLEETFETDGDCEAVTDQQRMGEFLTESRQTIDDAIVWMAENIAAGNYDPVDVFDEQSHWDGSFEQVVENSCQYCPYAVGCQEAIRREVMFNV